MVVLRRVGADLSSNRSYRNRIDFHIISGYEKIMNYRQTIKRAVLVTIIGLSFVLLATQLFAAEIKFAVLSDVHYASNGQDKAMKLLASGKSNLPKILEGINKDKSIDFVVFTGDMLVDPYPVELKEFKDLLAKTLTKAYFVIPGNHDLPMDKQVGEIGKTIYARNDYFSAYRSHPYGKNKKQAYWSADMSGIHLIGLDSSRTDTWGGGISKEQMAWLKKDLKKSKGKATIIFAHHAPLEFYPEMDLRKEFYFDNSKEFLELLHNNPQAISTVTGHYHFPAVIFRDGVHHFSVPSIITYPCKYAVFSIDDSEVDFETVAAGDQQFVQKAKSGLPEQKDWRERFTSDHQMINLFRGLDSYSFSFATHD